MCIFSAVYKNVPLKFAVFLYLLIIQYVQMKDPLHEGVLQEIVLKGVLQEIVLKDPTKFSENTCASVLDDSC